MGLGIRRLGEVLGGKEPPNLTMGTVVLKRLTCIQQRVEKCRKQAAGVHEVEQDTLVRRCSVLVGLLRCCWTCGEQAGTLNPVMGQVCTGSEPMF